MRWVRRGLLLGVLGWSLACGAGSAEVAANLDAYCAAASSPHLGGDLPNATAAPSELGTVTVIAVRAGGATRVDGQEGDLAALLEERLRWARMIGDEARFALAVDRTVSAQELGPVLLALESAQVREVAVVAWSSVPLDLPPYADPALAAEVEAELATLDPSQRAVRLAQRIADEVALCPGAASVFAAIANAAPEQKCSLMSAGLAESLPRCPLTDADRVMTLVQVSVRPAYELRPTHRTRSVGALQGEVGNNPGATWQELWSGL